MMIKLSRQLMGHNSTKVRHYVSNNLRIVSTHRNYSSSYEGDGKTTVKVLNNDAELGLMVNSFSEVNDLQFNFLPGNYITQMKHSNVLINFRLDSD